MADINFRVRGDSSEAQAALRGVGAASVDMGDGVDDGTEALEQQAEAAESATESQKGLVVTMGDVVKLAKEVVKFVGESVAEYLKSADAQKELVQVAKDLDTAQQGLKKSIGEATLKLADQIQLSEAAVGAMKMLQFALSGNVDEEVERDRRVAEMLDARAQLAEAKANVFNLNEKAANDAIDAAEVRLRELEAAAGLGPSLAESSAAALAQRMKDKARGEAAKEAADAAQAAEAERLQLVLDAANQEFEIRKKSAEDIKQMTTKYMLDAREAQLKDQQESHAIEAAGSAESLKIHEDSAKQHANISKQEAKDAIDAAKRDAAQQASAWENLGSSIGASFVQGLNNMLMTLVDGGQNDPTKILLTVLDAVFQVVGTAVGTAFGSPQLGSAIASLASLGTHAIVGAANKKSNGTSAVAKAHDGAWIGAPRYHSGGWPGLDLMADEVPIIAKAGERMLSEAEVGVMGGPAAVDAAARGRGMGGGIQVQVQAIDAKNATEGFTRELGKALRRAQMSGLGSLALRTR